MIGQDWTEINGKRICEFCSGNQCSQIGILYLPGLGQNLSGPYFLYTQIANSLPMLFHKQIEYYGFGNSAGELHEVEYMDIENEIDWFCSKMSLEYNHFYIVSSGFSSSLAVKMSQKYLAKNIMLDPFFGNLKSLQSVIYIDNCVRSENYIDTAEIYENCDDSEKLFRILGESYNRTKGLYLSSSLLNTMISNYELSNVRKETQIYLSEDFVVDEIPDDLNLHSYKCDNIFMRPIVRNQIIIAISKEFEGSK